MLEMRLLQHAATFYPISRLVKYSHASERVSSRKAETVNAPVKVNRDWPKINSRSESSPSALVFFPWIALMPESQRLPNIKTPA